MQPAINTPIETDTENTIFSLFSQLPEDRKQKVVKKMNERISGTNTWAKTSAYFRDQMKKKNIPITEDSLVEEIETNRYGEPYK